MIPEHATVTVCGFSNKPSIICIHKLNFILRFNSCGKTVVLISFMLEVIY